MKKIISVGMVLLCGMLSAQAQQKIVANVTMERNSDLNGTIAYRRGLQLNLDDFQGEEEPQMNAVAMAYSGVSLRYGGSVKKGVIVLDIRMFASFDKRRSWCLPRARNAWTLAHEQRHFDITALNACALYRELKSYPFSSHFEKEILDLQNKYRQKNEQDQDEYDTATDHGVNREVQEQWNEKIIKALSECSDCYP